MTNYTCGRFRSEDDVNASVTAAVLLLVLAFVTATIMYCASQGWICSQSSSFSSTPKPFKLLEDDDDTEDELGNAPQGLLTTESVLNADVPNDTVV